MLGGIAAWRYLRRRSNAAASPAPAVPAAEVDPRAEALRAKLDEAREAEPQAGPEAAPEDDPEAEPEVVDPEERRRSVHEHGRAALEEMRDGDEASS